MFKYELKRGPHCLEVITSRRIQILRDRATLATAWEQGTQTSFDNEVQINTIPYLTKSSAVVLDLDNNLSTMEKLTRLVQA